MKRKVSFCLQEKYHLYNRGVDKRTIFLDTSDYERFKVLLYICNSKNRVTLRNSLKSSDVFAQYKKDQGEPLVSIGAYCLMPNHFHILLTPLAEQGISTFMLKLQTAYSMYFNKKYDRSGALFQGSFKSQHVASDKYLRYIYSYIHLNPAKIKNKQWKIKPSEVENLQSFLLTYPYSSISEYTEEKEIITSKKHFPLYRNDYPNSNEYIKVMIDDWIGYTEIDQGEPLV